MQQQQQQCQEDLPPSDIGTVAFPEITCNIFTANISLTPESRMKRKVPPKSSSKKKKKKTGKKASAETHYCLCGYGDGEMIGCDGKSGWLYSQLLLSHPE